MPANAACGAAADHVRMGTQHLDARLRVLESVAQEVARGVGAAAADAFENVGLRLLPKPLQAGDLAVFARLLKLLDRFEAEFVVQGLDLLWPQPGDVEHRHQPRWDRRLQDRKSTRLNSSHL